MILAFRRLPALAAMALCAGVLVACSDDDDPIAPPAIPAGVTVTTTGETTARVTWTAVLNADGYTVERAGGATGTFASVGTTPGTVTQFDDSGLQPGTVYRYRVATRRGAQASAYSSEATVTPVAAALAAPATVTVSALSPSRNQITYAAVPNAQGYVIQRVTGASGGDFAQVGTATTTTYIDSVGLAAGAVYRYRVQATAAGRPSSPFSVEAAVTVPQPVSVPLPLAIPQNRTLSRDTLYRLDGYTKVLNGATLRIPAGTRILGGAGNAATGGIGGALFVYRGARLVVEGTADAPVVFTSSRPVGQRAAGDWGGIVIIGRATTNRTGGSVLTESPGPLVDDVGGGGTQQQYNNGTDDNDSSGDIRYLRIEFGGFAVSQDNELNSLSMYAVGRGTRLEYVQAMMGLDDAFEWFGGTVDGRYLVSYETGDDHFDTSEGYRGRNQFVIGLQTFVPQPNASGSAGGAATDPVFFEADGCAGAGCTDGFESAPYSMPVFANFTVVGTGPGVLPAPNGGYGIVARRGTGGTWVNGIMARLGNRAINVRDPFTGTLLTRDSLSLRNVFLAENVANFDPAGSAQFGQAARFASFAIDTAATGTTAISLFAALPAIGTAPTTGALDWTPAASAPAAMRTGGLAAFPAPLTGRMGSYFGGTLAGTAYRGAADPSASTRWWQGWTAYARN